jgi:vacuolar-type H+-ATPase subunit I/STV1
MIASKKFPDLTLYSAEELRALTPQQFADTLKKVTQVETSLNNKLIQLETQSEALKKQHEELQEQLTREFGMATVAELEALREEQIEKLAGLYSSIDS